MGDNVQSTSLMWAGRLQILVPNNFNIYNVPRKQNGSPYTVLPVLTVQSYNLSYYQHMGEGGEGRLAEHSVHRCRTADALQMRLMAQIIVSYGAILSLTAV